MTLYAISILSVAAFGLCVAEKLMLPVTTCKRNSTDYSACLTRAAQESWPRFVEGLPEFDFPRLDPLFQAHMNYVFDTGLIRAEVNLSNVISEGLAKLHFSNIRTHYLDDAFRLEIDCRMPTVFSEGDMTTEATVGGISIYTNGHFNATVKDISGTWNISGHVVNDTPIVEHFITVPDLGKVKVHYTSFEGNQVIYDVAVDFINEYWPEIYRIAFPILYVTEEAWLIDLSNRFFAKVSFSELFPEN